jgi:hypothetical protein
MRPWAIGWLSAAALAVTSAAAAEEPNRCEGGSGEPGDAMERQVAALDQAVAAQFGKERPADHALVAPPRPSAVDAAGNLVFEVFDIYPAGKAGAPPTIRRLKVVLNPCTFEVVTAYEPKA